MPPSKFRVELLRNATSIMKDKEAMSWQPRSLCISKTKRLARSMAYRKLGVMDTAADVNILQVLVLKTSKNRPKN